MTTDEDADWARYQAAQGDMRIQIVQRAINQGALAGLASEISEYAAWLVVDALDTYDEHTEQAAYGRGFRQGVMFEQVRTLGGEDGTPPVRRR